MSTEPRSAERPASRPRKSATRSVKQLFFTIVGGILLLKFLPFIARIGFSLGLLAGRASVLVLLLGALLYVSWKLKARRA